MTFGPYVKDLREKCGLTLRQFCRLAELDASNWSKVERGILPPPKTRQQINDVASVLAVPKDSEAYKTMLDLAAISHMPTELLANDRVAENISIFLRTARNKKPKAGEVAELLKLFRQK
ncbi:MAG: helix-turn-helix transcriptional regulator [Candidatus Aminicenantes bacterium]|nr:helix-turn-helix transcriptional regulator [Candidatus Aminicenantes bacterium]